MKPRTLHVLSLEARLTPTVTTSFDAGTGLLTVTSDAADAITITAAGPLTARVVAVNGGKLTTRTADVKSLVVQGGPGANHIQLAGVGPGAFRNLTSIAADGGDGNDTVLGSTFADSLIGGAGFDLIRGRLGNDTIQGGADADQLFGDGGDDQIEGNDGNDSIIGSIGNDSLSGGLGDDTARGGVGSDSLFGGGGRDSLDGGVGDDRLESADPASSLIARAGFNDASGYFSDPTADSPYKLGSTVDDLDPEPGWSNAWDTKNSPTDAAVAQSDIAFEGDGALRMFGGTVGLIRSLDQQVTTGLFRVSQRIYLPSSGQVMQYTRDDTQPDSDGNVAAQWVVGLEGRFDVTNTNFWVLDRGVWEDTGIAPTFNAWTKVDLVVDMTAKTWDLYIDDVKYNAPDPLGFRGDPPLVNRFDYLVEDADGVYIDDIQIRAGNTDDAAIGGDELRGGPGNDMILGGAGDDLLLGGTGADSLDGGDGRDILIGSVGADSLEGGLGEDIVIGGRTNFDGNPAALAAIQAEWTSSRSIAVRFANLSGSGGLPRFNANYFLKRGQVFGDAARDTVHGASAADWFLHRNGEDDTDLAADDLVTVL